MRILTKKNQEEAEKRLAAILIIITHGDLNDPSVYGKAIENIAEIAYSIGGMAALEKVEKTAFSYKKD